MAKDRYTTVAQSEVEINDATRIVIQMSTKISTGEKSLSLNKQWRNKTGEWEWGKGFQIPEDLAVEFLQKVGETMGLDVQFAIDSSETGT